MFCVFAAKSQHIKANFDKHTVKDGLSSNTVYDVIKDKYGFVWIATDDGLNRFDGTNFTFYRNKDNDTSSLRINYISSLYEDSLGQLWIGTSGGGFSLYNRKKDAFYNFNVTIDKEWISEAITGMMEDNKGNLWITSFDGLYRVQLKTRQVKHIQVKGLRQTEPMLCIYKDHRQRLWIGTQNGLVLFDAVSGKVTRFSHNDSDPNSLVNNNVLSITEDNTGNIWAGTLDGLSMLSPNLKSFRNYRKSNSSAGGLSNNYIHAIKADDKNQLWIGTDGGLNILDIKNQQFTVYHPNERNNGGINSESIRSIYFDNHGICWLGTYQGGLNKFDRNFTHFNHKQRNAFDHQGLSAAVVTSFAETADNNVFVGTDGGGLNLFRSKTGVFDHINITPSKTNIRPKLSIMGLEMANPQTLWISTYFDGLFAYNPQNGTYRQFVKERAPLGLSNNNIFCTHLDRNGNLWIGTDGGGVNMLDKKQQTIRYFINPSGNSEDSRYPANNVIRTIEEDGSGKIWIGTFGAGVSVYDPDSKRFVTYNKGNSQLPNNYVLTILKDHSGQIWVGTNGGGISLFNPQTGKFRTFSEKDGLANDIVHKILEDKQGKIWASTNQGLSSLDRQTFVITNYDAQNGLQNSPFVLGAGLVLTNGDIYFGGQNGINYFSPSDIRKNLRKPGIALVNLYVENKKVLPEENGPLTEPILYARKIEIRHKQSFAIEYVALNYTNPSQNQYEYKLRGFDKEWIRAGKSHKALYTNLSPGTYEFHVRAINNDGVSNEKARTITVVILPPFWLTPLAFFFYIAIVAGLIFYVRKKEIRKLRTQFLLEQERQQAKQMIEQERSAAEHAHMLDQMKIKFLTNLSHEFRTPISLIMGPVENLLAGDSPTQIKPQLELVRRNGRRLLNLVNQLLDFRKMEQGELTLNLSATDLRAFLKDTTDSFVDMAERKGVEYKVKLPQHTLKALLDVNKLERILFNLLSNAFKFTDEGGKVTIQINVLTVSKDTLNLFCQISDTGIGIAAEDLPNVFNRFYQTDNSAVINNQGSGIGLSIAKEFIRLHGGNIKAESEPGLGSTFSFEIPLSIAVNEVPVDLNDDFMPQQNIEAEEMEPAQKELPLILIIDDEADFRFYLKENLKQYYRIIEAPNGHKGWQLALSMHPDLIISDVSMPVMDGMALSRKLKKDKRTLHIPLIVLTASNQETDELMALESEANDFITKPFNFAILQTKIRNLLALNDKLKATYSRLIKITLDEVEVESEEEKFLKAVMLYIENNLNDPQLSVDGISREFRMSRGSFYNKILELTGLVPVKLINSVKLERAVQLIEKSDLNVAQIAYQVGFSAPNYFSKAFKEKYHMSPSEYIQSNRKRREKPVVSN
ncbi:two-component regulator propeller domain-containing protein [Mucilaginibacter terrae]|uniref:histidine kinase n=1 Tax=Mucilaginibacter terrae TaxID=1955052 RepID=A0ABU3H0Y9_9SPHI|nr:two-component regulator propeller domain-containing protein [Mucilaginibacter terrae]MDT3405366.1 signal transduction histidine kinase/ligand-binding sensor domain-containing protein/DNA-binding response OmpR family regulator [Mucilaginibacter terrae]